MTMFEDYARRWWRAWSTRWDAIEYAVLAYLIAKPEELPKLVAMFPDGFEPIVGIALAVALFSFKTTVKGVKQRGRNDDAG